MVVGWPAPDHTWLLAAARLSYKLTQFLSMFFLWKHKATTKYCHMFASLFGLVKTIINVVGLHPTITTHRQVDDMHRYGDWCYYNCYFRK